MTLLAFDADRRAAVDIRWSCLLQTRRAEIDPYRLPVGPTAANPPQAAAAAQHGTDIQTR